ncbi:MAG: hypothetical protein OEL87_00075 [Nanoarchaeota archaeon]|nr:hypothetical protein [Nanoarchaeota archaeon]
MKKIASVLLIGLFVMSLASAGSYFQMLGKETTCLKLNITDFSECDMFWCEEVVSGCGYDENRSACICNSKEELNYSEILNLSEIESMINNRTTEALKDSKNYTDTKNIALSTNVRDNIASVRNETNSAVIQLNSNPKNNNSDSNVPAYLFVGGLFIFGLGLFSWNQNKKKNIVPQQGYPNGYPQQQIPNYINGGQAPQQPMPQQPMPTYPQQQQWPQPMPTYPQQPEIRKDLKRPQQPIQQPRTQNTSPGSPQA